MAYPYKKMDEADFDYIRKVTAPTVSGWARRLQRSITGMRCRNTESSRRNSMWRY